MNTDNATCISFTKRNHDKRYSRGWNGIYHYLKWSDGESFRTECGVQKRFDECMTVTPTDDQPSTGWLCNNCYRIMMNLANKPYEEQYVN